MTCLFLYMYVHLIFFTITGEVEELQLLPVDKNCENPLLQKLKEVILKEHKYVISKTAQRNYFVIFELLLQ